LLIFIITMQSQTPTTQKPSQDNQTANSDTQSNFTILIVEDDQVLMKMYTQKLVSEGFKVLNAVDGEEAFAVFVKEKIDLIITDIMLPRVSGIEFLQKIRVTPKGKNVPVIVWSNLMLEEEKKQALALGANEYVVKGQLKLEDMAALVRKYMTS